MTITPPFRPFEVAVLDLYDGEPNQGMRAIRTLLAAVRPLRDGKGIDIPGPTILRNLLLKKLDATEIGDLLKEYKLISE